MGNGSLVVACMAGVDIILIRVSGHVPLVGVEEVRTVVPRTPSRCVAHISNVVASTILPVTRIMVSRLALACPLEIGPITGEMDYNSLVTTTSNCGHRSFLRNLG